MLRTLCTLAAMAVFLGGCAGLYAGGGVSTLNAASAATAPR